MDDFFQWSARLYKKPAPILIIVAALTVAFAFGIPRLTVDNDIKSMLPRDNRALQINNIYDREENFGPSNAAMIAIESPDIFSLDTLRYIKEVGDELDALNMTIPLRQMSRLLGLSEDDGARVMEGLRAVGINDLNYDETLVKLLRSPDALQSRLSLSAELAVRISEAAAGVDGDRLFAAYDSPMGKIQSLVNADYIAYEDDSLVARNLVDGEEIAPETVDGLEDRIASWDSYEGMIVSKDRTLTSIVALIKTDDKHVKAEINDELIRITRDPPAGMRAYVAGESVVIDHLGKAMMKDIPNLVVVVLVTLVVLLLLSFRTAKGIVYPLLNNFVAVIWTMGLMGYTGVPLTIIGAAIAPLLMSVVSAYGIHQVSHYYSDAGTDKFSILQHNAKSVGLAIFLSGITLIVGFGSLYAQEFIPIRQFGIFTAFGALVGVVGALLFLPALLMTGSPKKGYREFHSEGSGKRTTAFLKKMNSIAKNHTRAVLITAAAICLIMVAFASQVKSDMDIVKFFSKSDSVRESNDLLNARMAGTKDLAIILDSDLRDPVTREGNPERVFDLANPEVLQRIDRYATDVRKEFPFVTKVVSFADALKKINQELNDGDPSFYSIPSDPDLVSQYLMIFSGDTKSLMTVNHDRLRIMLTMNDGSIDDIHEVALYSQAYFDPEFQEANHVQVLVSGYQNLIYEANRSLLRGTFIGIALCIVIVFLILLPVLRSFWMSVVAIVPIIITLIVEFGFLGLVGIELNTATALISSIAIGNGIDFSIHFITWYRRELLVDRDIAAAIDRTVVNKGQAILYNLFVLVGGFLSLVFSNIMPIRDFGLINAVCMTVTAGGALLVVPAILRLLANKRYAFLYLGVTEANPDAMIGE